MSLKTGYKQIALPVDLVNSIEKFITKNPQMGYKSTPEFIREAIRMYLRKLESEKRDKKQNPIVGPP